ncbi:cobalamin synthase [mine drainage metagenome]|uniref:Adenosylcobinamide-GDP ribazoletransferase n=1 Tax=mine drainage metagenome TaxID=410659 RepID=A0A1J5RZN1_9ZZZZ
MRNQLNIFFTALMFFTRIPVPKNIDHSSDMLQKSARYFSWVGFVVGVIASGSLFLFHLLFSPALSVLFSMIISILITGAFHEDGFADVCDAFGGGWTKEKILLIMKDSRLGTYGVAGLIIILAAKFLLLLELLLNLNIIQCCSIYIAANSISRLMTVTIMQQYNYVADIDTSKSKPLANRKLTVTEMSIAVTGGLLPFLLLKPLFLLAIIPGIVARIFLGRYFNKWIGGYTGDCLGATQQVCEIFFYIGCILIWKYI